MTQPRSPRSPRSIVAAVAAAMSVLFAGHADGDVWRRAVEGQASLEAIEERYTSALVNADGLVTLASSKSASISEVKALLAKAEKQYREAAEAKPDAGEPYFRIGKMLHSFYFGCNTQELHPPTCDPDIRHENPTIERKVVDAWDLFEAKAPLDPRISHLLTERGIMRTKLVNTVRDGKPLLEGAMRDYERFLDRMDGISESLSDGVVRLAWGNLAETYMMLDRLDDAIPAYEHALRNGGDVEIVYGLAVALDRDDRGKQALELIRDHGIEALQTYLRAASEGRVFYVPYGESYYYTALLHEAFGELPEALSDWDSFLKSGAHPEFQRRAREHVTALRPRVHAPPRVVPSLDELVE